MANKYYLNETGLARLLDDISTTLAAHTTSQIEFDEVTDPVTGETTTELVNPDNFISAQSIVDYLEDRDSISISQDVASSTQNGYNVSTNQITYNGEEAAHIDLALITSGDIDDLFTPVTPPEIQEEEQ